MLHMLHAFLFISLPHSAQQQAENTKFELLTTRRGHTAVNRIFLVRVRLTLFRNKNTWSDDGNGVFGAFRSSKDNTNVLNSILADV